MQEIKNAFGQYMVKFFTGLVPTTKAMADYVGRDVNKSIVMAPGRMIDEVEEMLATWRKHDNTGSPGSSAFLPIIIVAMGKDYSPVMGDFSRQLFDMQYIVIPEDQKERIFGLRQMLGERRIQVAICAADEPTARSIAAQFLLYLADYGNRVFRATYRFAGINNLFPVQLQANDPSAVNVKTEQKNLTVLAIDIMVNETIPLFSAPKPGEPNDGKGSDDPDDPSGYGGVVTITAFDKTQVTNGLINDGDEGMVWAKGEPLP